MRELIAQAEALEQAVQDDLNAIGMRRRAAELRAQAQAEQPAAQGEPVARVVSFTNGSYWRNYTLEWTGEASVGDKLYLRPDPRLAATEQPAEAVAHIVSSGRAGMPLLQWMSADHSFRAPIGTKLYAHPDPRLAALEALLRALDSLTNPDENFDSAINPGPERDELLVAYTACKEVPR